MKKYDKPVTQELVAVLRSGDDSLNLQQIANEFEDILDNLHNTVSGLEEQLVQTERNVYSELKTCRKRNHALTESNDSLMLRIGEVVIERNNYKASFEATLTDIGELQQELELSKKYISNLEKQIKELGGDPYL